MNRGNAKAHENLKYWFVPILLFHANPPRRINIITIIRGNKSLFIKACPYTSEEKPYCTAPNTSFNKTASEMLSELKTNLLSPKNYYQLYTTIFDELQILQNYFKNNNFRCWKRKATLIKETAKQSYPSISKNDELVYDLSQMATLIKTYQNEINKIKIKLIEYGKQTKYFNKIN